MIFHSELFLIWSYCWNILAEIYRQIPVIFKGLGRTFFHLYAPRKLKELVLFTNIYVFLSWFWSFPLTFLSSFFSPLVRFIATNLVIKFLVILCIHLNFWYTRISFFSINVSFVFYNIIQTQNTINSFFDLYK